MRAHVDKMTAAYLRALRDSRDPAPHALAMAQAVARYVADVLDDDPGDENNEAEWVEASQAADALAAALRRLTGGAR